MPQYPDPWRTEQENIPSPGSLVPRHTHFRHRSKLREIRPHLMLEEAVRQPADIHDAGFVRAVASRGAAQLLRGLGSLVDVLIALGCDLPSIIVIVDVSDGVQGLGQD